MLDRGNKKISFLLVCSGSHVDIQQFCIACPDVIYIYYLVIDPMSSGRAGHFDDFKVKSRMNNFVVK